MAYRTKNTGTSTDEKLRRCLMCGKDFLSEWAGNRICKKCRSSAAWKQGVL